MKGQEIHRALQVIEEFRKIDPEMPIQQVATFLFIVLHEGCTMKAVADSLCMSQGSSSRNVAALSDWHRLKRPGAGLVKSEADPYEMRRKIITLLPKGKRVVETVKSIMEG